MGERELVERRSRSRSLRRASIMTVPREIARRRAWSESERECATCYTGSDSPSRATEWAV